MFTIAKNSTPNIFFMKSPIVIKKITTFAFRTRNCHPSKVTAQTITLLKTTMNYIIFNSRDQLLRLEIAKIVYFEADGNYTKTVMTNKLSGTLPLSLGNVEKVLSTQMQ